MFSLSSKWAFISLFVVAAGLAFEQPLEAQLINVGTPFNTVGDTYFERMGVNFGFSIPGGRGNGSRIVGLNPLGQPTPNINFTQNGFGSAVPPFGGYDPAASARTGFGVITPGGGGFSLGFEFGKGSSRTSTSTVPSITVPNGYGGSIGNGVNRPFVTGLVPVVFSGDQTVPLTRPVPTGPYNGVTKALETGQLHLGGPVIRPVSPGPVSYAPEYSSAESSDISVAAIKAQQAAAEKAQANELNSALSSIDELIQQRDFVQARKNIWKALRATEDRSLKSTLRQRLADIRGM
jgi:hypothetical protein